MNTRSKWILLGLTAGFTLLDQASKWLAQTYLVPKESLPVIPDVFHLTLAYNTGAAFSLLRNQPQLLTGLTALLFLILLVYGFSRRQFLKGELLATALVLGGALGNLLDRLLLGHVIDYFDVVAIHYPIFNVADSFIFCGVIVLAWRQLTHQPAEESIKPMPAQESSGNE